MMRYEAPIGPDNDKHLKTIATGADLIIAAWSQDGGHRGRSEEVRSLIDRPMKILKMGRREPQHPLYLLDSSVPLDWPVEVTNG